MALVMLQNLVKEEAQINWSEPAALIVRKIRGYNPFRGAIAI